MADRYTTVTVLCEDMMHLNFVRRYLMIRGVNSHRIRAKVNPSGLGAGSQYVINNYPIEVQALRSKRHIRAGLIAVADADALSAEERLEQFQRSLGEPRREGSERIAVLVPRRNVETWIYHLLGNSANETEDYKRRVSTSDLPSAVASFSDQCPSRSAEITVPSLKHACNELTAFLHNV
jgi:hypothetical protein